MTLAGRPVELTAREYGTLAELSANAGRVLTYQTLLRRVWGLDAGADVRPMRTTISSIRRKLGDNSETPPTSSPISASATACPRGKNLERPVEALNFSLHTGQMKPEITGLRDGSAAVFSER